MSSFLPLPTTTSQLTLTQDGQQAPLILVDGVDGLGAPISVQRITAATTATWDASQLNLASGATNVIIVNNQSDQPVLFVIVTTGGVQNVSVPIATGQWAKVFLVPQADITLTGTTVSPIASLTPMDVYIYITHT